MMLQLKSIHHNVVDGALVDFTFLLTRILIQKLINLYEPVEDPSPLTFARRLSNLEQSEGLLSYKATIDCITASKCTFARSDIDMCLLTLLEVINFYFF